MVYKYAFSEADDDLKRKVWEKGRKIVQKGKIVNTNVWRWDKCGDVMKYSNHGDVDSKHGWEIDHIKPSSKGGTDNLPNLQPLNWQNNRKKGDSFPWSCPKVVIKKKE